MKKHAIIVLFLVAFPLVSMNFGFSHIVKAKADSGAYTENLDAAPCESATYEGEKVHHLFTHALIAHPDIAFKEGNEMGKNYDIDCLTPKEFKGILHSLYERNYCLVDASEVYYCNTSGAHKKQISLPNGKKPLILSFDDINYYIKKMNMGMADKLIICDGKIATFTQNATQQISFDNDVAPILENFIASHPSFSHNGARGIINLTGFDGILGYRTFAKSANRANEIARVKPLIAQLKNLGWRFSCHSYGHYHMQKISDEKFASDTNKWLSEVSPLVGETDIYVYPYGEYEVTRNDTISPKHAKLINSGFRIFMGVGGSCYFNALPKLGYPNALIMDRVPLDGNTMRKNKKILSPYFNVSAVYDNVRPTKIV